MQEILHTHDWMQAETVRVALEAEGIRVEVVEDKCEPYLNRRVLAVSDGDAPRAIEIRRRVEREAAAEPTSGVPSGKRGYVVVVVLTVLLAFVYWWLSQR